MTTHPARISNFASALRGGVPAPARVLVVDDKEARREHLTRGLTAAGYEVAAAGDRRELFGRLSGGSPVDAVVIASVRDGGGVRDLLDQVLACDPRLTIVWSAPSAGLWADFSSWVADETCARASDVDELKRKLARALARRDTRARAA